MVFTEENKKGSLVMLGSILIVFFFIEKHFIIIAFVINDAIMGLILIKKTLLVGLFSET